MRIFLKRVKTDLYSVLRQSSFWFLSILNRSSSRVSSSISMVRRLELGCCHIHGGDYREPGAPAGGPGIGGWGCTGGWSEAGVLLLALGTCGSVEMTSQTWTRCVSLSITAASGLCLQNPVKAPSSVESMSFIHSIKESVSEHLIVGSFVAAWVLRPICSFHLDHAPNHHRLSLSDCIAPGTHHKFSAGDLPSLTLMR